MGFDGKYTSLHFNFILYKLAHKPFLEDSKGGGTYRVCGRDHGLEEGIPRVTTDLDETLHGNYQL